jgi:hypothetical protein
VPIKPAPIEAVPQTFPNPPLQVLTAPLPWEAGWPLRIWHLASLDAPTVAVVWTLSFAGAARVRLPWWTPVLVALVVWAVYVADRLLDARGGLRSGVTTRLRERHWFHWRHRRVFAPLAAAAAGVAVWIVFRYVPTPVRHRDTVLAAAALAYFTLVHVPQVLVWQTRVAAVVARLLPKELLVGVLFTAGCVLPAWARVSAPMAALLVPAVAFALLGWLNCALIERWESAEISRCGSGSRAAFVLVLAALVCAGFLLAFGQPRSAGLLAAAALSALLLAGLDRQRVRIAPVTLRAAADLVLLVPVFASAAWLAR